MNGDGETKDFFNNDNNVHAGPCKVVQGEIQLQSCEHLQRQNRHYILLFYFKVYA